MPFPRPLAPAGQTRRDGVIGTADCGGPGKATGARHFGVPGVRTWEAYGFKGQVRVWWSLPRPHQKPEGAGACGQGGGSASSGAASHPGRPRFGPIRRGSGRAGRPREPGPCASGGLGRPSGRAGKHRASALLPIFPVSVLYCFLLLKLTCLIGNRCRIVSRGLLWNISTAVSFN